MKAHRNPTHKPQRWEYVYRIIYSEQDTNGVWQEVEATDLDSLDAAEAYIRADMAKKG